MWVAWKDHTLKNSDDDIISSFFDQWDTNTETLIEKCVDSKRDYAEK